ncbi:cation diffusion facilitator family transporter [Fluoribacter dumoffii]|uniref:Ferrous-iron efflux pump FieF n=1 Tax=Fluoribacter dumoffii TaxID=463 RepID=A0A377GCH7_9GAMM|nr:cation diffusion facilitator family transporter [Fluoribacter dumoffii]KTC90648.1 cation-efflux family protein [Fluoribacter dumoffii NY 23]MCW8386328.1 cation diffusion facilitator family transporter [Fluoribacter dumoffii]MCW8419381.1 cation diffusion facilitator family transporter [Fluoribacter dumoffii]MCW8452744.1 cation diffusion facilitator family transporter [Fluoribacter dumoffii]MCW8460006.1 cation diffusion facilitator family transporter [Fluoribacter dumoffii]
MMQQDRYWQAKKVTILGAVSNALLGIIKLLGGYFFHSHALVADGVHSLSDLITDAMVLFASKYGSLDADASHPYGHQRIETAATLLLSLLLIVAGLGIAWDSLYDMIHSSYHMPNWLTLPIICISIMSNETLFHYTLHIGKRINSKLITANAWHHRSDAASSLVVLIGLIGSIAGYSYLDAAAAIIVGLMIVKMGWDYAWNSVKELVDTAVSPELLARIEEVIQNVDGVEKIHQLRSRSMGEDVLIDVHILVSPRISVSEGHYIAQHVHHALIAQIESVNDVIVHVDPEDDETSCPSLHLPSRKVLQELLANEVRIDFPQILFWNLHYLDGTIGIDIVCDEGFTQWQELRERVILALKLQSDIVEVRLFSLHESMYHN